MGNASEAYENFPIGYGSWECEENIMDGEGDGNGLQDGFNCSPKCDWSGSSTVRFNIKCRKRGGWTMIENSEIGPLPESIWDLGYWDDTCHLQEHANAEMIVYNHECEFDCYAHSFRSPQAFLLTGSGTKTRANFEVPYENYVKESQYAVVKGQFFIFGGGNPDYWGPPELKIAKLEGCSFVDLPVQLNFAVDSNSAALSIENGEKALVCFDGRPDWNGKKCDVFDGSTSTPTFSSTYCHRSAGLALYKGNPTAVSCSALYEWSQYRKVETLTETGWVRLPDHPLNTLLDWNGNRDWIRNTGLLGLPSGSMLLFGNRSTNIWRLKEDEWSIIGRIKQDVSRPGLALFGNSIYVIPSFWTMALQRVDLDEDDEVTNVAIIGTLGRPHFSPLMIPQSYKSCVEN